jgi:hypothetical protein
LDPPGDKATTGDQLLRGSFAALEVNADYTEAVLSLNDQSRLCFCHRVGERWAKAVGPDRAEASAALAEQLLALIAMFRLNRKHLDVQFTDGSRWEHRLKKPASEP